MVSFRIYDVGAEKANAISRYNRFRRIASLLRFVELLVFLIVVSRFSTQFLFSVKVSGEYFRGISVFLISPQFVFLIGNAIVAILLLKSRRFSSKNGDGDSADDFYEEYVEKCRTNNQQSPSFYDYRSAEMYLNQSEENQQPCDVYEYKSDEKKMCRSQSYLNRSENEQSSDVEERKSDEKKMYRSQSEKLERTVCLEDRRRELRRSATERYRKIVSCGRKPAPAAVERPSYKEDDMSSEEFRRTVEAFIARQQKSLREEEDTSAVVSLVKS